MQCEERKIKKRQSIRIRESPYNMYVPSEQRPQHVLVVSEAADTESNTFSTLTNNVGLRPGVRAVPLSIIYNMYYRTTLT